MLTTAYTSECTISQSIFFKIFFTSGGKGALTSLTKILRTFLAHVQTCNVIAASMYMRITTFHCGRSRLELLILLHRLPAAPALAPAAMNRYLLPAPRLRQAADADRRDRLTDERTDEQPTVTRTQKHEHGAL